MLPHMNASLYRTRHVHTTTATTTPTTFPVIFLGANNVNRHSTQRAMPTTLCKPRNDAVFVEYVVAIREDFECIPCFVVKDAYCAGSSVVFV
mmetsp:Transcript_2284/g.3180  ORF Transcript_2284/g.3180 Transcript_2284/m.3180 type:complete len:92 (-) Transcript_2284:483-758(-)